MKINQNSFRKVARIIAMIYAIPMLILFPFVLAFGNRPWGNYDYIFAGLGCLYLVGLFLGIKWQGLGGSISAIFPLSQIFQMMVHFNKEPSIDNSSGVGLFFLLLFIPSILYLISFNISRKQKQLPDTSVKEKNQI